MIFVNVDRTVKHDDAAGLLAAARAGEYVKESELACIYNHILGCTKCARTAKSVAKLKEELARYAAEDSQSRRRRRKELLRS